MPDNDDRRLLAELERAVRSLPPIGRAPAVQADDAAVRAAGASRFDTEPLQWEPAQGGLRPDLARLLRHMAQPRETTAPVPPDREGLTQAPSRPPSPDPFRRMREAVSRGNDRAFLDARKSFLGDRAADPDRYKQKLLGYAEALDAGDGDPVGRKLFHWWSISGDALDAAAMRGLHQKTLRDNLVPPRRPGELEAVYRDRTREIVARRRNALRALALLREDREDDGEAEEE